jgi:hypothetical protein
MTTEKTVTITAIYRLTKEEQARLAVMSAENVSRTQKIEVTVSAREALEQGWASLRDDGHFLRQGQELFSYKGAMRLRSDGSYCVEIYAESFTSDHILSADEAIYFLRSVESRKEDARASYLASQEYTTDKDRQEKAAAEEREECRLKAERDSLERKIVSAYVSGDESARKAESDSAHEFRITDGDTVVSVWRSNVTGATWESLREEFYRRRRVKASAWIAEHGSERLKKIAAMNLLDNSMSVYRDERLAAEMPGWRWTDGESERSVLNPRESDLDALISARAQHGEDVDLLYIGMAPDEDEQSEDAVQKWTTALRRKIKWAADKVAYLDLD